ncbi:YciK family oxidoreductase [Psychrobacter sp. ANT_H56B]|uniref:YciK family oxidoreductase n=1 Tax=Psychrobacter sp. ANT_H56B TaxID=2597353 RepID=UPI0011F3E0D4|nr:YciK family oxidoreductase [Psychrobacter sp. ANT_H56B]KAA0927356.1 YciK family oxidoreductase [Psychrobacter sp. ANT_H56B]
MSDNINPLANPSESHSTGNAENHLDSQQNDLQAAIPALVALTHDDIRDFGPTENCLDGKTILVTGAGDGIGRIAALTYARYGATVLLLGRTSSKLEYVYDEIESFGGKQPAMLPMNLEGATYAEMQKLANLIHREVGQLDGVLHNAGMLGPLTPLEMYDVDMFAQVMKINFTATFMLTQALLPLLKDAPHGSIVFTSSSVGTHPRAFWGAYALSKQAVEGMSDIFTQETQNTTNLRFNCINPGGTRTNMRAHAYPGENPMSLKTPEDIMAGYVCLMSDESIGVRGQVVELQPKD